MKVYSHVYDGYNCYLLDSEDIYSWVRKIKYVINNYDKQKNQNECISTSKNLMLKKEQKILIFFQKVFK